ncbi:MULTISPECIES: type II toxin-antitoxin system RelE/ParE family toxin [Lactiplantibacillus]|uniref:type II toxin-antitoxin system RelE/ParE family toxin n=1 Tax=Lactiplantibacillus TaxID=2767842 RepID=UPI001C1F4342|nr:MULTISPECIES: type II toxin-antitoxin system RelE/ParE family toxin [Lactiplantibacillus]MBU7447872.1 type II toxin-antitoxin system RelE/ParE family toxin [Lactiplantibacillus sp. 7.2.4]MBU7480479.1 type II toxin-antitoxin system RelE/ParE family toxin [Lactiplantibacillus pentosus]MBU7504385.1 type II toxin-antitoxin system RelE/ParE family toxin [Lactiplantibacillus pentosus]MCT0163163.1 hypothetical protein [Lactiplantibacillus pentosus]MDY1543882.1 type II toxin-antitoxin system RelE/P
MRIVYKNSAVKKQCTELRQAKKDFSEKVAKKLLKRVIFLESAESLESVINDPTLHFHDLKADLDGYYAIDVDGRRSPYRLIMRIDGYSKELVFSSSKSIEIIKITEVSNHYE